MAQDHNAVGYDQALLSVGLWYGVYGVYSGTDN